MQVITKMKSQVFQLSHLQRVSTRGISFLVVKHSCLEKYPWEWLSYSASFLVSTFHTLHGQGPEYHSPWPDTISFGKPNSSYNFGPSPAFSATRADFVNSLASSAGNISQSQVLHVQILKNNPALLLQWPIAPKSSHLFLMLLRNRRRWQTIRH